MAKDAYRIHHIDLDSDDEYDRGEYIAIVRAKSAKKALKKALKIDNLRPNTCFKIDGRSYSIDYFQAIDDYGECGEIITDCFCLFNASIYNDWAHFAS